jgi:hypothetical protein
MKQEFEIIFQLDQFLNERSAGNSSFFGRGRYSDDVIDAHPKLSLKVVGLFVTDTQRAGKPNATRERETNGVDVSIHLGNLSGQYSPSPLLNFRVHGILMEFVLK